VAAKFDPTIWECLTRTLLETLNKLWILGNFHPFSKYVHVASNVSLEFLSTWAKYFKNVISSSHVHAHALTT
jgi:hypothetical protein